MACLRELISSSCFLRQFLGLAGSSDFLTDLEGADLDLDVRDNSVPSRRFLLESKVLRALEVLVQIDSCFSNLSELKGLEQY